MSEAAATLALRHVTFVTTGKTFVLGGRTVPVHKGVVEVSADEPLVALSLWHDGYRINVETDEEIRTPGDLEALLSSDAAEPADDDEDDDQTPAVTEPEPVEDDEPKADKPEVDPED